MPVDFLVAVARAMRPALGHRLLRFATNRSRIRSPYARVLVKVAFHGFWPGFRLGSLLAAHPYLELKYDLVECGRRPDVHFISVFGPDGRTRHDAREIPLPADGRPTVFYTGEHVSPGAGRFDWSISFDESSARNLYLPGWVRALNRLGLSPWSLIRRSAQLPDPVDERRPCAYLFRHPTPQRETFFDRLARRMEIVSPSVSRNNHPSIGSSHPDKLAFLRHFRFNIAFENEAFPRYLTEKIADAFTAGCIPIYHGDPLVEGTFSPAAFVHVRDESDFGESVERIVEIDRDPTRLATLRNEAPLVDNRLPDYATHDYAMAFFERILDSAVRRGYGGVEHRK